MKVILQRLGLWAAAFGLLIALSVPFRAEYDGRPMFGHDPLGTPYNTAEKRLSPANVAGLQVLWRFCVGG